MRELIGKASQVQVQHPVHTSLMESAPQYPGALAEALGRDVSHQSACQAQKAMVMPMEKIADTQTQWQDFGHSMDIGIGM